MGARGLFIFMAFCIASAAALLWLSPASAQWCVYIPLALAMLSLVLLYRRVVIPSAVASRGLELIASQDFNNFLAKVGERNADKVVKLFNTMIAKLRNERLRNLEQENFLNLLIEASPVGVLMLDFDQMAVAANRAFLSITGIGNENEILGKRIEDIASEFSKEMANVPLGESRVIRQGDMRMWKCSHLHFVQTGFRRDFYLLESLTEEVMKAERGAYEKVIRTISHEVNNTMGGVKTVLDIMQSIADDEELREVIESCSDRCDKMCSFISAYADVVKLPNPAKRRTDLAAELKRLHPFLLGMARDGIEIRLAALETPVEADVDMPLMQQAIVNIVKNAIESIEGTGLVEIRLSKSETKAMLEISNNGAAITPEVASHLFTPFFTTKRQGKGLGLTLISDILKKHGAEFRLFTDQSQITRFTIRL